MTDAVVAVVDYPEDAEALADGISPGRSGDAEQNIRLAGSCAVQMRRISAV